MKTLKANMNTKSFRRNHSSKPRSTSSTFISLHFNKADEDQLEISYKDDTSIEEGTSNDAPDEPQTNPDAEEKSASLQKSSTNKDRGSSSHAAANASDKTHTLNSGEKGSEFKSSKFFRDLKSCDFVKPERLDTEQIKHKEVSTEKPAEEGVANPLKLSPAVEAVDLEEKDFFDNYLDSELEKAKCEIVLPEKNTSSGTRSLTDIRKSESLCDVKTKSSEIPTHHCASKDEKSSSQGNVFYNSLKKSADFVNFARNNIKFHILAAVLACFFAPIPSWLSGFLVGTILSSCLVYWLYKPGLNKKNFSYNSYVQSGAEKSIFQEDSGILKGWMNELPSVLNYNPENYHVSCTRSVYVRLDGSYLRFSFPPKNIPKRAMFNEPRHDMQFIYQQHYDISDATVELLPKELANKRLWSKKYPICLRIPNCKEAVLSNASKIDLSESFSSKSNKKENLSKKFASRINENNEIIIYLFSRTDRDKSVWYYRFKKASKLKVNRTKSPTLFTRITENDSNLENKRTMSLDFAYLQMHTSSQKEISSERDDELDGDFVEISLTKQQKFEMYISSLLAPLQGDSAQLMSLIKKEKKDEKKKSKPSSSSNNLTWLNVFIGRLFYDFLTEDVWAKMVTEKIQRKLNRIKLPFYLTELTVKDVSLGSGLPKIHQASEPSVDEKGLWMDVDLSYNGSFHMTLETKLSLRRLKSEEFWTSETGDSKENDVVEQSIKRLAESDEDSSLESSSDDEAYSPDLNVENSSKESQVPSHGSTGKKLLKFVDRLAQSSYFQQAANNKYIKKAMDDISNTPLVLTVEVQWLTGTLAINIPPWPTDRLWYGFRTNPSLSIIARPQLGQHVVTFTQVTEWIEKKLVSEFQKLVVMPNMDDLIIPIMRSSTDSLEL